MRAAMGSNFAYTTSSYYKYVAAARDCYMFLFALLVFKVSLSGPGLEFQDADAFFSSLGNSDGNSTEQGITLAGFVIALLAFRCKGGRVRALLAAGRPFLPYLLIAGASMLWSEFPDLTFRRFMRLTIEMSSASMFAFSYCEEFERLVKIWFYAFAAMIFVSFAALIYPSRFFTPIGFVGIFPHKLYLGACILEAVPFLFLAQFSPAIRSRKYIAPAALVCCLVIFPLSSSKTAFLCLPIALCASYWLRYIASSKNVGLRFLPLFGIVSILAVAALFDVLNTNWLIENLFGDTTLTGRDLIWQFVFNHVGYDSPLGVGFGAMWQTGPVIVETLRVDYRIYAVNQAHNGYIETYAQLGWTGVAALGFTLLLMGGTIFSSTLLQREMSSRTFLAGYFYTCLLVMNITDTSFYWAYTSLWYLAILTYMSLRFHMMRVSRQID